MRIIWRLEAEGGKGPYVTGACDDIIRSASDLDPWRCAERPTPLDDEPLRSLDLDKNEGWFFGFANLAQYRRWFNCHLARGALGKRCKLVLYSVDDDDFIGTPFQAVFIKERSTCLGSIATDHI